MAVDGSGHVYLGGFTYDTFDGTTSAGGVDGFIRAYTQVGSVRWTHQFGTPVMIT